MVGVVRALDADIGENAEMNYRIIGSDGPDVFDIATNRSTQDGIIVLRKVGEGHGNGLNTDASRMFLPLAAQMLTAPHPRPAWIAALAAARRRVSDAFNRSWQMPHRAPSVRRSIDGVHHVAIKRRMT